MQLAKKQDNEISLNLCQNLKWADRVEMPKIDFRKLKDKKMRMNISPESIRIFGLTNKDFEEKLAQKDHISHNKLNLYRTTRKKNYAVTPVDKRDMLL